MSHIQGSSSAAEQFFQNNPYELPEEYGHVWKCEIFKVINLNSYNFRRLVQLACDSDHDFSTRYEPYRSKRIIPIKMAEEVIRRIVDDESCIITFFRKETTV